MASAESHRQMVVSEIEATMPCSMAVRARSGACQRASGTPLLAGSSHARALIATTTSGGESRGPPGPWLLLETGRALLAEAFAPLGNDLSGGVQTTGDLIVAQSIGGQQHDPGPYHIAVRSRIASGGRFEPIAFVFGQFDLVWAGFRHVLLLYPETSMPANPSERQVWLRHRNYVSAYLARWRTVPGTPPARAPSPGLERCC